MATVRKATAKRGRAYPAQGAQRFQTNSVSDDDIRFSVALYTAREAARYLGVRPRTFHHWVRGDTAGRTGRRLITTVSDDGPHARNIPFVGLAEGAVIAAFRRVPGVSMQKIHAVLEVLEDKIGVANALASKRLYLHGGEILYNHAAEIGGRKVLAEIITDNLAFNEVVEQGLRLISYDPRDFYASRLTLPSTPEPLVEADPYRASGQPITLRGAIRVVDIVDRFRGHESPAFIANDFGIEEDDVLEVLRAFYSPFEEAA